MCQGISLRLLVARVNRTYPAGGVNVVVSSVSVLAVLCGRAMLTRLWQTVKGLRELNRTAPEILARARAREAEQVRQVEQAVQARHAISDKLANTLEKTIDGLNREQQAALAKRMQGLQERLGSVQLDSAKIQQKAMSSMVDSFETTLLRSAPGASGTPTKSTSRSKDSDATDASTVSRNGTAQGS